MPRARRCHGTPVTVTSGVLGGDPQVGATVSLAGKLPGTRVVSLRARGRSGIWGLPNPVNVAVESSDRFEWPETLEYAWNPAGPWTVVAVQPGTHNPLAQITIQPDLSALAPGTRMLWLRGVDSSGSPGLAFTLPVAIVPGSLTGNAPPPAKLAAYLQNAGGVVAGSYREIPLDGWNAPLHHSFTMSLAGLPAGQAADVAAHVISATGETSPAAIATFTVVVEGTNGYAAWKNTPGHFTAGEKADDAISGLYAAPDCDDIPNVLEFAGLTHPRVMNTGLGPRASYANGKLTYTFRQIAGDSITDNQAKTFLRLKITLL